MQGTPNQFITTRVEYDLLRKFLPYRSALPDEDFPFKASLVSLFPQSPRNGHER